jgi:signal transduction histidine kinase
MTALNALRTRLFLAIAGIVVLSIGATFAVGLTLTRREVEKATLRDVSHQADLLFPLARATVAPSLHLEGLQPFLKKQEQIIKGPLPLDASTPYLTPETAAKLRGKRPVDGTIRVDGTSYFFAAREVQGRAFVLLRPKHIATAGSPFLKALTLAALVGASLAALAALLLSRAVARPVRRVLEASRRLARGLAPSPVPVEGPNELRALATSFNEMAEQLRKARDAERSFLLSVSHELKTPLTAIRGYAEALDDEAVTVDEAVETIRLESARLERLVHDLLDLARMNKAEFSIRSEPIDLGDAAREVYRRYEQHARAFDVRLEVEADEVAPAQGDSDRILQVVSNLVENALRLTPAGGVVRVVAEPRRLTVVDTGPGLRPDELPRAFERFFLYSRYGNERPVGTGLGLAIVKQLAEGMGGSVEVESEPGRQTRFRVTLPPATAPVAGPTTAAQA